MTDERQTREQLVDEIGILRRRVSELEQSATRSDSFSEALEETSAKYKAIVDAFDGLIYICSQDYNVEFVNHRFMDRVDRNPIPGPRGRP